MEYVRLGQTGMKVSKICLGCMSYGSSKWQPWVLEEEPSLAMIKKAYDVGINFFDTANVYSSGVSEEILGKAIKKFNFSRSKIVVATKVFAAYIEGKPEVRLFGQNPEDHGLINENGLSRKHIFDQIEASLRRLQLDYIDLYQIHRFDPNTPVEETMEALHDLVKSGKVRYIGASSMYAWQFQKMQNVAKLHGWTQFVTMQNLYNLIYREEEREMIPYCLDTKVGLIPWSPLAGGKLARRPNDESTTRAAIIKTMYKSAENDNKIVERVWEIADKHKVNAVQIALAWIWSKSAVSSPILGISKVEHLEEHVAALKIKLTPEDIKSLEELYEPRSIYGHS